MFRQPLTIILACLGAGLFAKGAYIPAKAVVAQHLLEQAWEETAKTGETTLPWASLDAYPAARLKMPDGKTHIVLSSDSGQALAFGPGLIHGTSLTGETMVGISAHKNTHFGTLKDLSKSDVITLELPMSKPANYRVTDNQIIDTRIDALQERGDDVLALVTCYPFDALSFNGPLRYVVFAERIS